MPAVDGLFLGSDAKRWDGNKLKLNAFESSIIPNVDNTYDLGSSTKKWRNLGVQNYRCYGYIWVYSGAELKCLTGSNFVLPTSAPTNPVEGSVYYDIVTDTLYIYDGFTWKPH